MEFQNYIDDLHIRKDAILKETSLGGNYYAVGCMDMFRTFTDFLIKQENWSFNKVANLYQVFTDTFIDKS